MRLFLTRFAPTFTFYKDTMSLKVASYYRRGFTISRRASIAHKNNQHPMSYWIEKLRLDKATIKKMLNYAGHHHTGLYAKRTRFYRLPDWENEFEVERFYRTFHSIPVSKKKFIAHMEALLQEEVEHAVQPQNQRVRSWKNRPEYLRLDQVF